MANIELVIKIPEEAYKLLKNEGVDWLGAEHILNAVANGTPLPKEATNGDVIKDMFPNVEIDIVNNTVLTDIDNGCWFSLDWWNALYKRN